MARKLLHLLFVLLISCAAQAEDLCVATYNVRYKNTSDNTAGNGWDARKAYLIGLINFQQPDLLGVQEAMHVQMTDMANGLSGYTYIGVGRNDGATSGEYSAIFYRKERMMLVDWGSFWLSDTPNKPSKGFPSAGGSTTYYRICTWGKFYDKVSCSLVYHFNTHLDLDETNRQQSYYLIKSKIEEIVGNKADPVIVTGDLNAVQTSDSYKLFYNSGFLYDSYNRAKQKFITEGTCDGFNADNIQILSSGEMRRIDHIFVTKAFNVEHYGVLNPCYYSTSGTSTYQKRRYSDHDCVIAKVSFRTILPADFEATPPPFANGAYQISTAQQLQAFSCIVNGKSGFEQESSAKAVLTADIDMSGVTGWEPIGTSSLPYEGTFDGQGHAIENLTINTGNSYSGLFGKTSGAIIKNFRLSGMLTVAEETLEHGIVGYAENTTIQDVHSALNITTDAANGETKHIGGVAGTIASISKLNRCSFAGTLTDAGTNTVGGIAGYADQSNNNINYCINYGTVHTDGDESYAGGILGYTNYSGFRIQSCANIGDVSGNAAFAGQIIGRQAKTMTAPPSNLYYMSDGIAPFGSATNATSATGAASATPEDVACGKLTAALNAGKAESNMIFFQNLNAGEQTDAYPVIGGQPEHKAVFVGTLGTKKYDGDSKDYNFYVNRDGLLAELPLDNGFSTPVAFTAVHASYRNEQSAEWGTICLPFVVESTDNIQFYEVVPELTDGSLLAVAPSAMLEANTPALYKLSGGQFEVEASNVAVAIPPSPMAVSANNFTLLGAYDTQHATEGYVLSGDAFQYVSDDIVTNPFEALLTSNGAVPQVTTLHICDATGLVTIEHATPSSSQTAYDLAGRKVAGNHLKKGIYIINSQKYIRK